MNKIVFKCPQCGANLDADEDREFMFCQFCGHKILLDQISKSELEIKRMEHEEKMMALKDKENRRDHLILIGCIAFAVIFLIWVGFMVMTKR